MVPLLVVITGVGGIHSSTFTKEDVPEQPLELVTVTAKLPDAVMVVVCVVLPFDQA